jgi:hypothetical protein
MEETLRKLIRETLEELHSLEGLVFESKKQVIVNKLKLPLFVADWINDISEKFSIWFADHFKKNFLNTVPDDFTKNLLLKQLEKGNSTGGMEKLLRKYMNSIEGEYRYIADWMHGRTEEPNPERDFLNLKSLTFDEALNRANAWHEMIAQQEIERIEDEDGEVILTFPDRFYWVNLGKRRCDKEARAMGHCGRGEGNLFSLRKDGFSFVTADILPDGTVKQMRGRANTKPKKEYHKYIIELLKTDLIRYFNYNNYRSDDNFYLKDLDKEQYQNLLFRKPSLAEGQRILKNLDFKTLEYIFSNSNIKISEPDYYDLIRVHTPEKITELKRKYPQTFQNVTRYY